MDHVLATIALAGFVAFLAVLIGFVPALDLIIVCVFVAGLAAWDFWKSLHFRRNLRRR